MNGLLLLILALPSNACIVTYQVGQPATMETLPLPRKELALSYSPPSKSYTYGVSHKVFVSFMAGSYPLVSTGRGVDELERVFASNDVLAQNTTTQPPDQGLYCEMRVWNRHSPLGH